VFTDLDGTLLDEKTYSYKSSIKALEWLQVQRVPVVFCSSKTRKEQEALRKDLNVRDPFIVENGSAVIIPPKTLNSDCMLVKKEGTRICVLGEKIASEIHELLYEIQNASGIELITFRELSARDVAILADLDEKKASLAKEREYSAVIVNESKPTDQEKLEVFNRELKKRGIENISGDGFLNQDKLKVLDRECKLMGLKKIPGGRYLSVAGEGASKGNAVKSLLSDYPNYYRSEVKTAGCGDSENDEPMLKVVDFPYLVQRPNDNWQPMDVDNLIRLPAIGPQGFSAMVEDLKKKKKKGLWDNS
jgi:mannosyl-3-phosphoglycerate phosphatase family protein